MYAKYRESRLPVNFGFLRNIGQGILARNILGPGTYFLQARAPKSSDRSIAQHSTAQHNTAQQSTQHGTQHGTQHSTPMRLCHRIRVIQMLLEHLVLLHRRRRPVRPRHPSSHPTGHRLLRHPNLPHLLHPLLPPLGWRALGWPWHLPQQPQPLISAPHQHRFWLSPSSRVNLIRHRVI